jgi:hypothetical protein
MPSKKLATLAGVGALLVAAPAAHANHVQPNLGLEVTAVDPATRTVQGIQHCTSPDRAGRPASFPVTRDIDFNQFQPGMMWGIAVDASGVILSTGAMPCDVQPQAAHPGPGASLPPAGGPFPAGPGAPGAPTMPRAGAGADMPVFARGFLNRVWKFGVEIDGADAGKINVTIGKVLNLPRSMRTQDDALVDEAAIVVLSGNIRIYKNGKPAGPGSLDDLDGEAVIHGKLLAPSKWEKDEDGDAVPTIRARKIYL